MAGQPAYRVPGSLGSLTGTPCTAQKPRSRSQAWPGSLHSCVNRLPRLKMTEGLGPKGLAFQARPPVWQSVGTRFRTWWQVPASWQAVSKLPGKKR